MSGELFAVLVDTNPYFWTPEGIAFDEVLETLCIALNMHLSTKADNRIVLYSFDSTSSNIIFPLEDTPEDEIMIRKCNYEEVNQSIIKRFLSQFAQNNEAGPFSKLSSPLSKALCYINSKMSSSETIKTAKVLIISKSKEIKKEYSSLMNAVFAANKKNIPIDTMMVVDPNSKEISSNTFLIQASYLSKGINLEINQKRGLIQYFTQVILIETKCRDQFVLPPFKKESIQKINIAICKCGCNKEIEKGYVCSVCLRLYCDQFVKKGQASCLTCKKRFDLLPDSIEIEENGQPNMNSMVQES